MAQIKRKSLKLILSHFVLIMKDCIATGARSPNKTPMTLDVEVVIDWMNNP